MNIKLNLSRHCVETEMKRLYNKSISEYFKAESEDEKKGLEDRIELLQKGLESFDFNRLRSRHPELSGEKEAEVQLFAESGGRPGILINGDKIDAD